MTLKRPRIFFTTTFKLCENNGYLSTQIRNFFSQNGLELVNGPEDSDCIVISTCGFDQERENLSRSVIDDYVSKYAGRKEFVICGCLPKINPDLFDPSKVRLIGPKELQKFNEIFHPTIEIENISGSELSSEFIDEQYGFLDAYYVQICQGCVNDCTYCGIKRAKGYVKSKPINTVLEEIRQGIQKGFERVLLLADDCGSYGVDRGVDLAELLNEMKGLDIRININYIEPRELQDLLPGIDEGVFEKIDFIDLPIQSTSARILKLMNRKYEVGEILEMVEKIKRRWPHIYLETQVIYGFPSETREEFRDLFRLVGAFDSVIYFYYTDRKDVKSASLPGKQAASEVIRRTEEIMGHPRYAAAQDTAEPPLVLLGYGLDRSSLFRSIEKNCGNQRMAQDEG